MVVKASYFTHAIKEIGFFGAYVVAGSTVVTAEFETIEKALLWFYSPTIREEGASPAGGRENTVWAELGTDVGVIHF